MRTKALFLSALLAACDANVVSPTRSSSALSDARAATPSSLTATATSATQIDLTWTDNVDNETGWEIHRSTSGVSGSFSFLATRGANVVRHPDSGLMPLTDYCYKVRSYRRTGAKTTYTDFTNTSCSRTFAPPLPPTPGGVTVRPVGSTAVQIDWQYSSMSLPIRVEKSTDAGTTWTAVGNVQAPPHYYVDGGLTAEESVCYRLIALDGVAESLPSNVDCTIPPAAPSNITFEILDDTSYVVRWSDNSAVETGYQIYLFGYRLNEYFGTCYDEIGDYPILPANVTSVVLHRSVGFGGIGTVTDGGGSGFVNHRIELTPPPEPLCWG